MTRSLVVQSILYGNNANDIIHAARATANSARIAKRELHIGEWSLALGDCSETPVLSDIELSQVKESVESAGGSLTHYFFGENLGHGGGHNKLAPMSSSELLLILNPDALLGPDTISRMATTVVGDIALADARQLPLEHPKDYDPVTGDTSWASGACSLTVRSVFDSVGGFDHETFFMYCDDVDYSWRVKLAGHRVVFQPAAHVFHDKRLTLNGDIIPSEAEIYYSAEAAVLLAYKYSRDEIAAKILSAFGKLKDETYLRVVKEFGRRRDAGQLPRQLDPARAVAQFVSGNYAVHRF